MIELSVLQGWVGGRHSRRILILREEHYIRVREQDAFHQLCQIRVNPLPRGGCRAARGRLPEQQSGCSRQDKHCENEPLHIHG